LILADPDKAPHFSPMEGIDSAVLTGLAGENIMMVLTTIQPGCDVPEHKHPHEQVGMVRSGKARMKIGGKEHVVEKGDVCVFPSNILHSARCLGDAPFVMLDIVVEKGDVCVFPSNIPHSARCLGDAPFVMLDIFNPAREDFIKQIKKSNQ